MLIIIAIISGVFFAVGFSIGLISICRRFIAARRIRKYALSNIGSDVSIHSDKGARFAYKGIYAHLNDDHSKALKYLKKAVSHAGDSHNSAFCLDWMSKCYDALEKSPASLRTCIEAVRFEPMNLKALFNLADSYVKSGSFEKAEYYYKQILRYSEDNAAATFMLGTLLMGRGLYEQAEEQFLKALELDPDSESSLSELSVLMAIKGDYTKMDSYFARAERVQYIEHARLQKRLSSIKKMKDLCNDY